MDGWETWFQNVAGNVITAATAAKYQQPFQLQQSQLQAMAANPALAYSLNGSSAAGISPSALLLIGGAIALVLLLKD